MNLSAAYQKKKQEWLDEGKEEGKEEGVVLGINQVALSLIHEGFSSEIIAKATKLTIVEIEKLRSSLDPS